MKSYSVLFPVLTLTIWPLILWAERVDDFGLEPDLAAAEEAQLSGSAGSEEPSHGEGQMTLQVSRQGAMIQQRVWANSTRALEATGHVGRHDALRQEGVDWGTWWCQKLSAIIKWLKSDNTKQCLLGVKDLLGNPVLLAKGFSAAGEFEGVGQELFAGVGHEMKAVFHLHGFQVAAVVKTTWSLMWNAAKILEQRACGGKMGICKSSHAWIKVLLAILSLLMAFGHLAHPAAVPAFMISLNSWSMTHGGTDFCDKIEKAGLGALPQIVWGMLVGMAQAYQDAGKALMGFFHLSRANQTELVKNIILRPIEWLFSCAGQMLSEVVSQLSKDFEESAPGQWLANVPVGSGSVGPNYCQQFQEIDVNCGWKTTSFKCGTRECNNPTVGQYPICSCYTKSSGLMSSFNAVGYYCSTDCFKKVCGKMTKCGCTDFDGKTAQPCINIMEKGPAPPY